jgi:diguanylate cyclase (GGDEF)-like protein
VLPAIDLAACAETTWQATPDLPLRVLIAAGLVALAGWASAHRPFAGRGAFAAMSLVMAAWVTFSLTEHAAREPDCKATVALLSWPAIVLQPALHALFLFQYLNSDPRGPAWRVRLLLALPPLALAGLALSNGAHGLFYGPGTTLTPPVAGMPRLRFEYGPIFYAAVCVGYAWVALALGMVLRAWATARPAQRNQWAAFLVAMLVPLAANASYIVLGWRLFGADPTPTAFAATALVFGLLIGRNRLFTVVPLARRALFAELPDPVLVLDGERWVRDANDAALRMAPPAGGLDRPLAEWPRLGPALLRHLGTGDEYGVLELHGPSAWYEVQRRPLATRGASIGELVVLHDVSASHEAHNATLRTLAARQVELEKATALQALLREQAMHDALTGVLNRRALDERHAHERGGELPLALVLLDLDHFKRINDTHGHAIGDAVLRDFAAALRTGLRASDALFRIGGEEFALLMPGVVPEVAERRVETLRGIVAQWRLAGLADPVTFSAGVAASRPPHASLPGLLEEADAALYRAKRDGRNRTAIATGGGA